MNTQKNAAELVIVLSPEYNRADADALEENVRETAARLYAENIPLRLSAVYSDAKGLRFKRQSLDKAGKNELFFSETSGNFADALRAAIEYIYDRTDDGAVFLVCAAPGFCPVMEPVLLAETAERIQTLSRTRGWLFIGLGNALSAPFFKRLGIDKSFIENAKKKTAGRILAAADLFSILYPVMKKSE